MLVRNGRIFISHVAQDQGLYTSLVTRLSEKHIDCWTTISPGDSDTELSAQTLKEIAGRDVFLRICTPAAARSGRMRLEASAARALEQEDIRKGTPKQHVIIDLLMDPTAIPDAEEMGYLTIDTTTRPMNDWLVVLYNEAGMMQAKRAMSRRTMTIIVLTAVTIAVLLILGAFTFFALFHGIFFFT